MAASSSRKNKQSRNVERTAAGPPEVFAAGGLVSRTAVLADERGHTRRGVEIVVVHRPRYDDWSFPKGKLDTGESFEAAALREVAEETGLECELGVELPSTEYLDAKGRRKLVRYWAMQVVGTRRWAPNREIDERRWVSLDEAGALLSYAHDRALLDHLRDDQRGEQRGDLRGDLRDADEPGTHLAGEPNRDDQPPTR